jgi:hypothetical protein
MKNPGSVPQLRNSAVAELAAFADVYKSSLNHEIDGKTTRSSVKLVSAVRHPART